MVTSVSKLILTSYEQSVCRVHFILVGQVIGFIFVLIAIMLTATIWYHYSLPAYALLASVIAFYSAWILRIRLLVISGCLLFGEVAFKLVALVIMIHNRIDIYHTCYLNGDDNCDYEDWKIQCIQLLNGITFLLPSTLISLINTVSIMYLIYLFRYSNGK